MLLFFFLSQKCLIKQQIYLPCNNKTKTFYVNGNAGPIIAHMDTQSNNNLCLHLQAFETRQVDDPIEALSNWTSVFSPSFRQSMVSSGNVKKTENSLHSWTIT